MNDGHRSEISGARERFVFHDASGRRWTRVRRGLQLASLALVLGGSLFLLSLETNPRLPDAEAPTRNLPSEASAVPRALGAAQPEAPDASPPGSESPRRPPLVFGYYVNWDQASLVSLRRNLEHLTHLVPQWLCLRNERGDLEDTSDPAVARMARERKLPIIVMVTNYAQGWQAGRLRRLLRDAEARRSFVDNIYATLVRHRFAGVNVDFEQVAADDRDRLTALMRELAAKLKPAGLLVTQSVPPDDPGYDVQRLAAVNDYIVAMVYDEHYSLGSPGPVASQPWFERQLETLAAAAPREKTIVGLGTYGYDWPRGARAATVVGFADLMQAAPSYPGVIHWDSEAKNPVLRYSIGGSPHAVWFLDAVTALNQTRAAARTGFRGMALWRLGTEDPGLWTVVGRERWPEEATDPDLTRVSVQTVFKLGARREILRVVAGPRDGRRRIWRASDGGAAERYEDYPSPYVVEGRGPSGEKVIALTFDDGPDPRYTPQILDTLRAYGVPATFFVLGVNAERSPELLRRTYADGHELGNHTYWHPNTAAVSRERTRLELNATQRIIQHVLGLSTTLFRPPYNVDSEPQTPEELEPILRAQELGYLTVGAGIDPQDWQDSVTADAIVAETIRQEADRHIVLLHDGGGDRSATLAALPRIIEYFRARGYRFVTVSDLMGRRRDEVMLPVPDGEGLWAQIAGGAFTVKSYTTRGLGALMLAAIGLAVLRSLVYGGLAVRQKARSRARRFDARFRPPVSVIVAAYNEERVVVRTVESVLNDGYPDLEVVIVNDGSTDRTDEVLRRAFGGDARVRVHTRARRGKAAALNTAVGLARHEFLIAIDADTMLRAGTIEKLLRHFADPSVGAVSGNVRVGNRKNWITRFQSIEYVYGFNLDRRALDVLNAVTVVPGAAGAWRKTLIEQVGGFSEETLAEDTDLTLAIRRLGHRILYDEEAVAYTEAPEDAWSLARQRFRWSFGTLQAAWKHRDATCRPQYGTLGFVALPTIWLFQLGLGLFGPVADVAVLFALVTGTWRTVVPYYVALFVVELVSGLLAYALEREKPVDLALLPFQRVYYRQFMHYVLGSVILVAIKGRLVSWGKLERRATCQPAAAWPSRTSLDRRRT
jgi:peptidoglycan-N-acetylglucosamine deacetylase